jgi:uncharacterized iron-regulated membrane protein
MKIVDPNSTSAMADYLILFAILAVVIVGLASFVIWWKLSFKKEGGKSHHRRARRQHGAPNAADGSQLPMRGTGRTLAELGIKK